MQQELYQAFPCISACVHEAKVANQPFFCLRRARQIKFTEVNKLHVCCVTLLSYKESSATQAVGRLSSTEREKICVSLAFLIYS